MCGGAVVLGKQRAMLQGTHLSRAVWSRGLFPTVAHTNLSSAAHQQGSCEQMPCEEVAGCGLKDHKAGFRMRKQQPYTCCVLIALHRVRRVQLSGRQFSARWHHVKLGRGRRKRILPTLQASGWWVGGKKKEREREPWSLDSWEIFWSLAESWVPEHLRGVPQAHSTECCS